MPPADESPDSIHRVACICGIMSAGIGVLGLAGWTLGSRVLTGVRMEYIPIAPNTAMIIILLGISLFSVTRWPARREVRLAVLGLVSLSTLVAGLTLFSRVTGVELNIDALFINANETLGSVPVGHMSPVTALCFLLGCTAILLLLTKKNDPAAILGTVLALTAGVIIIGYWYGAPLLYGGTIIPVALLTAVALGMLGTGLIAAAGPASWPLSRISDGSTRAQLLRGLLPVIIIVILMVNWIPVVILGTANSTVVLTAAVMVIVSLVVVYLVVSRLSREIGNTIDNAERERKRADEALQQKTTDLEAAYEEITASEEELRANYEELARTQASLKENERKYRNLYTYAQVGLFETSFRNATVVTCNERYATLAGYLSVEEAIGSDILHLYANPEDRTEVGRILREQGHIENHILKLRNHATGKIFWAQFSARFNYEREVAEGSIIDITAQIEAESALRESEGAFRSLAENANDGFLVGLTNGMHVFANKRAAEITGYSIDELVHTSIRDLVRPDEFERVVQDRFRKRMAGVPAPSQYETILVSKGGRDIPIELSSSKIEWYGEPADLIVFRDTTKRNEIMEMLRESERRLREAQEMAHLGFWSWDIKTGQVAWSDEVFRIFGLDPTTFTPKIESILALSPWPEDQQRDRELIARAMESHESGTYEQRFIRPDKSTGYYHSTFQGRYNESGTLVAIVGTVLDITGRRKSEEALRESESRFRTLVEQMPLGIAMTRRVAGGEEVFYYNRSFTDITGYTLDTSSSFDAWALLAYPDPTYRGEIFGLVLEMYKEAERAITSKPRITRVTCRDGTVKDIEFRYTDLKAFGFWVLNDLTERLRAEEALRESEERFRQFFEGNRAVMLMLDPDTGAILDVNPSAAAFYGYPREEFRTMNISDVNQLPAEEIASLRKRVADGTLQAFAVPHRRADGEVRTVEVHSSPIRAGGRTYLFSVIHDITERVQAEQQREVLIRDLEQKNAELERFTYTVSHDLKSPLITIKGFVGLLEDDARSGDPEQLKRDVLRISRAADTMQALLNDVLELSRIGRVINPPKNVPFGVIAREAVELLEGPLAERKVAVEIAPDLPVVIVDRVRIREVMVNLIENAIKFFGDQPEPRIRIGAEAGTGMPVFFVQDNGIGIDPRYLTRIFNLFEKLDTTVPGTGIGLPIVRRIIEVHGGKIWAESEGHGKGTNIRFTLPPAEGNPEKRD